MTQEALLRQLQISCLGLDPIDPLRLLVDDVIEALTQPKQEPVAWMRQDGQRVTTASDRHNYPDYETRYSIPLYTTPPQLEERNFCPRCGKRTKDIHTCTPPQENT
jgi:hypothetical protein